MGVLIAVAPRILCHMIGSGSSIQAITIGPRSHGRCYPKEEVETKHRLLPLQATAVTLPAVEQATEREIICRRYKDVGGELRSPHFTNGAGYQYITGSGGSSIP
jgi:hypothetical protein